MSPFDAVVTVMEKDGEYVVEEDEFFREQRIREFSDDVDLMGRWYLKYLEIREKRDSELIKNGGKSSGREHGQEKTSEGRDAYPHQVP